MNRRACRYGYLVLALSMLATLSLSGGCKSILTSMAYVFYGNDAEAEFKGLKNKKIVVVCRPQVQLQYQYSAVSQQLAQQVGMLLKANLSKVTVVDQQKVTQWTDEHSWKEFAEVGRAMKADVVLAIELNNFSILEGQTLYRGKANVSFKVYDVTKGKHGEMVFEKCLPESIYPPSGAIPIGDKSEAEFRNKFVDQLAAQIGRHFYLHDKFANLTQDCDAGLE
jgi:hypothetical protein